MDKDLRLEYARKLGDRREERRKHHICTSAGRGVRKEGRSLL